MCYLVVLHIYFEKVWLFLKLMACHLPSIRNKGHFVPVNIVDAEIAVDVDHQQQKTLATRPRGAIRLLPSARRILRDFKLKIVN